MLRLYQRATEYGLHCLFEAHNEEEVKRIIDCGAKAIGINNRNLQTFEVNLQTFETLRPLIPSGTLAVAESGMATLGDVRRMKKAGADAVLIGEALMRAENPGMMLQTLKEDSNANH